MTCHCNAVCMHKSRVRYASWYKTYISPPKYIFMISLVVKGGWLVGKNVIGSKFPCTSSVLITSLKCGISIYKK